MIRHSVSRPPSTFQNHVRHSRRLPAPPVLCASREVQPSCRPGNNAAAGGAEFSRRSALLTIGSAALWPKQASAETEAPAPPLTAPQPFNAGSASGFKTFNEKDFVLEVPRSYKEFQDPSTSEFGAGGRPKSTYERAAALTPLRVKFTSGDGQELLTVIQRNASELKQSLLQITDISQLGSIGDVAKLILPREVQVLAAGEVTIPQEPRDTGTVRGVVNTPPQTIYRYTFKTRGQRAHLAAVAKAGKVYLTAGSTREDHWTEASDRLKAAVVSFRLV